MKAKFLAVFAAIVAVFFAVSTVQAQVEKPNLVLSMNGFDGTGEDYIEVLDSPSLDITDFVTIELWLFLDDEPYIGQGILSKQDEHFWGVYSLWFDEDTIGHFPSPVFTALFKDGTSVRFASFQWVHSGEWHHIAVSFNATTGTGMFYINGKQVSGRLCSPPCNKEIKTNDYPFFIGWFKGNGNFSGLIDELRIWRVIRTSDEINSFMLKRLPAEERNPDKLIGYWTMDDLRARRTSVIHDRSGNGNHGKLVGDAKVISIPALAPPLLRTGTAATTWGEIKKQ